MNLFQIHPQSNQRTVQILGLAHGGDALSLQDSSLVLDVKHLMDAPPSYADVIQLPSYADATANISHLKAPYLGYG